mgnify:CR=1 FL=1
MDGWCARVRKLSEKDGAAPLSIGLPASVPGVARVWCGVRACVRACLLWLVGGLVWMDACCVAVQVG